MSDHRDILADLMAQAIEAAQRQKLRVRGRLADMCGYFDDTPVRGPWKPGRPGVKWHLYQAARRKHERLTAEVRALAWAMGQLSKLQTAR